MKTERGFGRIEFIDDYGEKCSIQESSSVIERIWLGIDRVNPQIMKSDGQKLGLEMPKGEEVSGWMPYPIPEQVVLSSRMHLNRSQVQNLVDKLQQWLDSGSLD